MQKQLYPIDKVEDSIEQHLSRHSGRSQAVYLSVVLLLLAGLAALPMVRVGVSVQSNGIVRPLTEKHDVNAGASGFAAEIRVRENQTVRRGDVLVVMRAAPLDERLSLAATRAAETRRSIADLELLTRAGGGEIALGRFATPRFRQEYVQLRQELRDHAGRERKATADLERTQALQQRGLAPVSEVEDRQFQLTQARADRAMALERAQSGWQSELTTARLELKELVSQQGQLREERALYTVTAPVDGTVEEVAAVSAGSLVQQGQKLAVISPTADLSAEVYVTPRDIGLLRPGTPARVQIDAFNYNDWGFVAGRVQEISDDFVLLNQQPMFRVRVALDEHELRLRNGFRGRLRKGMTLRARFMVTERTLFQLLRDDVNDWLNPAQAPS